MPALSALIIAFPLLGFVCLAVTPLIFRRPVPEPVTAVVGVGSIALSALCCARLVILYFSAQLPAQKIQLWQWIGAPGLQFEFAFYLDPLTLIMLCVVTGVGLLIHIYAAGYMHGDDGYRRFFAYMNLFVSAMTLLVLADNLVLLYLGWELVGLCSFLLIGFWYRNPDNGRAAGKAFLMTRIGDTALLVGIIALFRQAGTLEIQALMSAVRMPAADDAILTTCALLLLVGAVGKSAQIPLQSWLPDAMAGPTPVSALIHAATMVTAGVYLIARCHDLFLRSEIAMLAVAATGVATLLVAGSSALVQTDIKRVLAYSTISQLGYMFAALGAGAFSAAIFHLVTHAFFKALLFLAAGAVILRVHHKQSLDAMGGLGRSLPLLCICFGIGCASLAALPLTAGYFSKEEILLALWREQPRWLWCGAVLGAFITGMYSFRLFYRIFFGPGADDEKSGAPPRPMTRWLMTLPLILLSVLALFGGQLHLPLEPVFGGEEHWEAPLFVSVAGTLAPLAGVAASWWLLRYRHATTENRFISRCRRFLLGGWGFDTLYRYLFVLPVTWLSKINQGDFISLLYRGIAALSAGGNALLARTQNGALRWYLATLIAATLLSLIGVTFLFAGQQ